MRAARVLRRGHNPDGERGSAALSAVILGGVLLLLPMVLLQGAMYFHSRSTAASAARHGVEAARVYNGSAGAGQSAAIEYVSQAGGPLQDPEVQVSRSATTATATVGGQVTSVVPGLSFDVEVTVHGPVERLEP